MKIWDWFKTKIATSIFAVVAFIGGFLFLNNSLTGNIILKNPQGITIIPIIGLLLILCSIILGAYSIRR